MLIRLVVARRNQVHESIGAMPGIVTEGKLIEVEGKVLLADMMETPHDPTFKQGPKAIEVGSMDMATHILTFSM